MFLAPLTYDEFFKKVFSNLDIAQAFLEDFFEIEIETITKLDERHKVTRDATVVEFDFRCKIDGAYVIIDMQQWKKPDIVQRFSLYHSLSSVLQLEEMPLKSIFINKKNRIKKNSEKENERIEVKDYRRLEPVITLIWMVDDSLKFTEDYMAYGMYPENIVQFLTNDALWESEDIKEVFKERLNLLKLLENDEKGLSFLQKNRLIFAFQENIVKNDKIKKYVNWFKFAKKTRDAENSERDFEEYKNKDFIKNYVIMKNQLSTDSLTQEELEYLRDEKELLEMDQRRIDGIWADAQHDIKERNRIIKVQNKELENSKKALEDKNKTIEDKDKTIEDKDKTIEDKDKALEEALAMIEKMKKMNK